jgi:hypothetical protein
MSIGTGVGGPWFWRGSGVDGCEMAWTRFERREVGRGSSAGLRTSRAERGLEVIRAGDVL